MSQTRTQSLIEAWTNILVGFGLAFMANALLFPLFGWSISSRQNFTLGLAYTALSLGRSYTLRRVFNRWHK